MSTLLNTFVHTLRFEAEDIISIELRPCQGVALAAFEPGAHIDLHLPGGMVRSYSLLNDSGERHRYVLGVLKDRASRGGSRAVHEQLRVGQKIAISAPRNNFALHEEAAHSVLVAGGIGITPLLCMARRLRALGRSFEMLYFARSRASAAFLDELQALGCPLHLHWDQERGGPPDLRALLSARAGVAGLGGSRDATHFYACGPAVMLDSFENLCAELGCAHAHVERFSAVEVAAASDARQHYSVELKRSGKVINVLPEQSLLAALRAHQIAVDTSCEEGICGSCETRVLAGTPDHRDSVLSSAEKAANQAMMVCVSGCRSERLVLDL
jgi:ferredoxin-NADP reductase